ncbi:response regulator [Actinokineospora bangkokensis]|uniref:DNA-binding response regulator n=1 Tax=Actinokineospora bangkokensis TaxID=1193682 RepID=A0A1Q9LR21_9PSEU|nr:response regulator transcription factor [Actinokineospora bangkokensis]OLR94468.1 DNA-binding response regulator [Actinokineospora bangkokensis]
MSIRVFLVDDHQIVRRGVADLLDEPDIEIVGEAASVAEALVRVPAAEPDVAVLDVRLGDGTGVELCRELRSRMPGLRCLMLTSYADDEALFESIMAGASGFVLKQVLGSDLVAAVRTVGAGGSLLDPRTTTALLDRIRRERSEVDPLAELTDQERTVFELIGEGLTNREIGERMFLAEKTVKNYVSHLLAKLKMQRRTQAAVLAAQLRKDPGQ